MVSRARDVVRVASLLKTDQSKLAVLSYQHAEAMMTSAAPFEDYPEMPLQIMFDNGTHVLVARNDLPLHHGFLIAVDAARTAGPMHLTVPLKGKFGMKVIPVRALQHSVRKLSCLFRKPSNARHVVIAPVKNAYAQVFCWWVCSADVGDERRCA
jgi:hypothetical protein